ncbi:MAG TPA: prenyltransferase/squalene oxidase repeat-containing protein [Myxococcota bacterium]|nr:prenyltransferase/squalene oxidase repeat-containing protein [Myxococcota bacterium]HRY94556.1 prenyltransferase/squalene oxidase repeat-containing protein [Myxococcota bacterium]HSA20178.1 prenyltransferase/squalene oxidase repeat-containing protein [Myxococcota bacterium]
MGRPMRLRVDPLPALLGSGEAALIYWVQRDLLGEDPGEVAEAVWPLPEVARLLRRQRADGAWKPTGDRQARHPRVDYALIETWKQLRFAVDQYGLDRRHPAVARAAEFVFSRQTEEGDVRGFLGNQVAMYYTGAVLALLCRAGYADDPRTARGLAWLLASRQDDGGWVANRLMSLGRLSWAETTALTSRDLPTLTDHDRSAPSSPHWTGMVLRAFAAHPGWRRHPDVLAAARLLKSGFFSQDPYSSYRAADHWLRFQFPFWWNNLVSALDCLSLLGLPAGDGDVSRGLAWLVAHQQPSGLWLGSYSRLHRSATDSPRARAEQRWITLAICRVLARLGTSRPPR